VGSVAEGGGDDEGEEGVMRITKDDLRALEKWVNRLLRNVQVRVEYRNGHTAIDMHHHSSGRCMRTVLTGLTKKEAGDVLYAIDVILNYEKEGGKK